MEDNLDVALSTEASQPEKNLSVAQVNDIVKREKARAAEIAAERVRQELEAKHAQELENMRAGGGQPTANGIDMDSIRKEVLSGVMQELQAKHQEALEQEEQAKLESIAKDYHLKMGKGSDAYDDYNEVMGEFKAQEFPSVAMMAAQMDNTPEIMYELAKNPNKLIEIDMLAQKSPGMARKRLEQLAQSIGKNLEAKASNVNAPAPLSRPKSSSVGVDNGKLTLNDFKKASYLRG